MINYNCYNTLLESKSGNYLVTIAIGESYYKSWEFAALPTWREYCLKNDIGIIAQCKGSYLENRLNDDFGCNADPLRRFWCSYKWSALRNPMVNYLRWSRFWTPKEKIARYEIKENTVLMSSCPKKGDCFKDPTSPKMKVNDEGYCDLGRTVVGKLVYNNVLINGKKYPCYDITIPIFERRYMLSLWVGWLRNTMRFESTIRFSKIKDKK